MSLQIPCQSAILEPQSPSARYVVFGLETARDVRAALDRLRTATAGRTSRISRRCSTVTARRTRRRVRATIPGR